MLNLRHPGNAHAHGGSGLLLAQTQLLAGLSELVPARLGEQPARTRLDFLGRDPAAFNSGSRFSQSRGCATACWRPAPVFLQVNVAEDARFELARGCPQHAFQQC